MDNQHGDAYVGDDRDNDIEYEEVSSGDEAEDAEHRADPNPQTPVMVDPPKVAAYLRNLERELRVSIDADDADRIAVNLRRLKNKILGHTQPVATNFGPFLRTNIFSLLTDYLDSKKYLYHRDLRLLTLW